LHSPFDSKGSQRPQAHQLDECVSRLGDQLQIKHVSGEQNRVADALSRVVSSFVSSETDEFSAGEGAKRPYATTSFLVQSSYRQIVKDVARSHDDVEWTKALLDWVKTGKTLSKRNALPKLPQPIKENLKHVHWESENGLMILRIPNHLPRIIIASCPASAQLRKEIIEEFHQALCHPGMAKTIDLVRKRYCWTGLKKRLSSLLTIAMFVLLRKQDMGNQGSDDDANADLFLWYLFSYFGCQRSLSVTTWCITMLLTPGGCICILGLLVCTRLVSTARWTSGEI